jgi:UDP-2-acetamido-3-amino-2,3-dideoxy-glucuronate N-acetyltransferase
MDEPYIHPTALVETKQIGKGTRIWAFSHVMDGVTIGMNCNIGDHCFIESGVTIDDNVTIKNGNEIWDGVRLMDGVFVGPHVNFTNDLYPRSPRLAEASTRYTNRKWLLPTTVNRGASLGAGAIMLAGVNIGEFSTVGAGAMVTRDVFPYSVVIGNPARPRGWVCRCGQRLAFQDDIARCDKCTRRFTRQDGVVSMVDAIER